MSLPRRLHSPRPVRGSGRPSSLLLSQVCLCPEALPGTGASEGPSPDHRPQWPVATIPAQHPRLYKFWWGEKEPCKQRIIVFNEGLRKSLWFFWVICRWVFCAVRNALHHSSHGRSLVGGGGHSSQLKRWPASPRFPAPPAAVPERAPPDLLASGLEAPASIGPRPEAGVVGVHFQQGRTAVLDSPLLCCNLGLGLGLGSRIPASPGI